MSELAEAKIRLVKREQRIYFAAEIKELSAGQTVRPKSSVKTLGAFLDGNGLLRVGGRLHRAKAMQVSSRFPLVLPKKSRFTRLMAGPGPGELPVSRVFLCVFFSKGCSHRACGVSINSCISSGVSSVCGKTWFAQRGLFRQRTQHPLTRHC